MVEPVCSAAVVPIYISIQPTCWFASSVVFCAEPIGAKIATSFLQVLVLGFKDTPTCAHNILCSCAALPVKAVKFRQRMEFSIRKLLATSKNSTRHTYGSCMLRQGSCQLCQFFCLQMLSTAGKQLVQSNMAQKASLLFPPGTESLPDIVTNYSSLKGSDKWTLQSIMLLVFRPVLRDVRSMVRLHVCLVHHHKTMRVYKLTNVYLDDSSDSNRQGSSCGCGVVLSTYGFITGTAQTHEKKSLQSPRNVL